MIKKIASLSDRLRRAINESGLSVNELAKQTVVQRMSIHRFLRGERSIRLDNAERLAEFFGLEFQQREGE